MKIGIDVGGSHIGLGLVNKEGELILKKEKDYEKIEKDMSCIVLETIVSLIREILKENSIKKENIDKLFINKNTSK